MSLQAQVKKEPFYFKSYDRVIGVAHDVRELLREMKRLANEDRAALEYHLSQGHIVAWLYYLGENGLAKRLEGVKDAETAIRVVEEHLSLSLIPPSTGAHKKRGRRGKAF